MYFTSGCIFNFIIDGKSPTNWKSSNSKVIKITSSGKLTVLDKGKVTISAKLADGKDFKTICSVTNGPFFGKDGAHIINSVSVKKGKTVKVMIQGKADSINNKYTNTKKAKIVSSKSAKTLKIKGLKRGTTTLKVKVNGVKTLKLKVKVK